ncbi:2-dehydropantoate 2-reductase [Psychrobacillus sp. FSL H8-0484]|uniref:ketopantoate reductase family protein n=1 Tax=Psychrobacillus sp. FSL H8-0484 TaxID=2921390 RepID=UPI0030FAE200
MNIGIVGAGAIGMLFGAYLSEAKHDVTFLIRNREMTDQLYIEKGDTSQQPIHCNLVYSIEKLYDMDLVIIAVKYHHLHQLKKELDLIPPKTPLLFLQNGLLHLPYVENLKQHTIILGSVLHGATKVNSTTVQHLGVGITSIGLYKGNWSRMKEFLCTEKEDFPLQFTTNIERILFKKAMLNCLINPLTTITKVQNGELIKNDTYKKILKSVYDELIEAFEEWKEHLSWEEVVTLCKNTEYNRSSMLKDYENGRVMELDTIVGAIIEEATKRNKALPILNTFYLLLIEANKVGERDR